MKPLDLDLLARLAREHEALITVEEGSAGGFGGHVLQALADAGLLDRGLKVRTLTLPDRFLDHGNPDKLYAAAGLDAAGIVAATLAALGRNSAALAPVLRA
jgi:1-deoxy-D-xylulose-5-phosphate synthase